MLPYGQEAPEEKRPLTRGTVEDSRKTNRRGNQIPPTKSSRAVRALPEAARWVTLGLAPPGYEIPPLRGWQKPLQDPTPVERARTVTRMAGVLNHALCGMVQTQVTAQGCLGSTPEGQRPQIRGWRAGGSLAVSSPTPATPLLSPAKIRELNHAAFASLSFPTDRQVVRNPHVGRPGFLVSMSIHPRTAARPGRHAGLLLTPNCQSRSA